MDNLNHGNDKIKAPQFNPVDNNRIKERLHYLRSMQHQMGLALEGYLRSLSYANSDIPSQKQKEGMQQARFYLELFGKGLSTLSQMKEQMEFLLSQEGN